MTTKIEWCMNPDGTPGEVWNPVTGCQKVSQGCRNCYAERIAARFWGERRFTDVICHEDRLDIPFHWKKPRRVFVNSMSDLFHEDVPDKFIGRVWSKMLEFPKHTFLILTKRPQRMADVISRIVTECERKGLRRANNIWLGVSAEDQKTASERVPYLLQTPAAVRFVSCEPLLGAVDLSEWLCSIETNYLKWVIAGGESGPGARPAHPDWARGLRDQCRAAGVPYFFKQHGEWIEGDQWCWSGHKLSDMPDRIYHNDKPLEFCHMFKVGKKAAGRLLDGQTWNEFPVNYSEAA
jgi:protein gp37